MPLPTRAAAAALFALVVACLAGCDDKPKLVPVSGRVLIDGQPLTRGVVPVVPGGYRSASGKICPDGRFMLSTSADNDECVLGTYQAAVVAHGTLGPGSQKWHAPKKYLDPLTAGLTVTGPTDDLVTELTWAGGKPFVEGVGRA